MEIARRPSRIFPCPDDVTAHIFSYLTSHELLTVVSRLNKKSNELSKHQKIWKHLCTNRWPSLKMMIERGFVVGSWLNEYRRRLKPRNEESTSTPEIWKNLIVFADLAVATKYIDTFCLLPMDKVAKQIYFVYFPRFHWFLLQ